MKLGTRPRSLASRCPAFEAQEMRTEDTTGISYWEGAILVSGESGGRSVTGRGYMELTGYVGEGLGSLFD